MKRAALWVLVPAIASAQPASSPPAPASEWPIPDEMLVSLRTGLASHYYSRGCDVASGGGLAIDAEVGWRLQSWFSLAAFVAYSHLHSNDPIAMVDDTFGFTDFGVRAQLHLSYVFAGAAYGDDHMSESSTYGATSVDPTGSGNFTLDRAMFEVHAGISIPITAHLAIQALVMYTQAPTGRNPDLETIRYLVGVQH